ncbi:MAG TPA: DcaP family trimeric outer membrane transporter, partial [Candidatus Paceibacterota bacterium]|nr:DcaP family trimeric outer membrane transporter [Candidatus Paceibacterota bacterium]
VGGILRSLSYDNNAGPDDSAMGWGLNVSGGLKTFGSDSLVATLSYGDGIGRYIQDLPSGSAGVVDALGDLHLLRAWGAMLGYRHQWSEKWRSTVSYGYVQLDSSSEQGDFAYDQTHYAQANLIWAPTKNFYVGLEYLYGRKEAQNGNSGDDHRVQLSLQYKLVR